MTYTYTYDAPHRPRTRTESRYGKQQVLTYDTSGRILTKEDYLGNVTEFQYDGTNRIVGMTNPDFLQVTYHYDPAGRLLNRILSNGARTDYEYDADNRLVRLASITASGATADARNFEYDRLGNLERVTDDLGVELVDYDYDTIYRLTDADFPGTADDEHYEYDDVGNRELFTRGGTTLAYSYDDGNRLQDIRLGVGGAIQRKFEYDANGSLTEERDASDVVLRSYSYDAKNQVASIDDGGTVYDFAYDPDGLRIQRSTAGAERNYLLEGEHLEVVLDENDAAQERYLRGVVVDEIVNAFLRDGGGQEVNYTYHHDRIGSVRVLSGHAGAVEATADFTPFGEEMGGPASGPNPLRYTGREYDADLGLYYYRARYYDPEIGRFLAEDPIGFQGGINFYAYVENNPINRNDPTGKIAPLFTGFIGGVGAAAATCYTGNCSITEGLIAFGAGAAVGSGLAAIPGLLAGAGSFVTAGAGVLGVELSAGAAAVGGTALVGISGALLADSASQLANIAFNPEVDSFDLERTRVAGLGGLLTSGAAAPVAYGGATALATYGLGADSLLGTAYGVAVGEAIAYETNGTGIGIGLNELFADPEPYVGAPDSFNPTFDNYPSGSTSSMLFDVYCSPKCL